MRSTIFTEDFQILEGCIHPPISRYLVPYSSQPCSFLDRNFLLPKKQQQPQQITHALKVPIHKPQFMGGDEHAFVVRLYAWGDSRRTGSTLYSRANFSMVSKY